MLRETHNIGVVESLQHLHLTPNSLLVPLYLLLRDDLQRYIFSDNDAVII